MQYSNKEGQHGQDNRCDVYFSRTLNIKLILHLDLTNTCTCMITRDGSVLNTFDLDFRGTHSQTYNVCIYITYTNTLSNKNWSHT